MNSKWFKHCKGLFCVRWDYRSRLDGSLQIYKRITSFPFYEVFFRWCKWPVLLKSIIFYLVLMVLRARFWVVHQAVSSISFLYDEVSCADIGTLYDMVRFWTVRDLLESLLLCNHIFETWQYSLYYLGAAYSWSSTRYPVERWFIILRFTYRPIIPFHFWKFLLFQSEHLLSKFIFLQTASQS